MDHGLTLIPDATVAQALTEMTALGLRMARAVTEITEVEQRAVAAAGQGLPQPGVVPTSLEQATGFGRAIDGANEALSHAAPRVATLSLCFDRAMRAVRRTLALGKRLEQGWPRALSDNRRAMLLRQADRGAGEAIRRHADGDAEAAERLLADLAARLEDPAFERDLLERPVEEMVRMLCRAIGLPPDPAHAIAEVWPSHASPTLGRPPDPG